MEKITVLHGTSKNFSNFELGKEVKNSTYGNVVDNGLGIFFTDNKNIALRFAGVLEYSASTIYKEVPNKQGFLITAEITLNKILHFENLNKKFDSSFDQYFAFIEKIGGVEKCRESLLNEEYDSIMIHNSDFFGLDTFNAWVVLNTENIKILEKETVGTMINFDEKYKITQTITTYSKKRGSRTKDFLIVKNLNSLKEAEKYMFENFPTAKQKQFGIYYEFGFIYPTIYKIVKQ